MTRRRFMETAGAAAAAIELNRSPAAATSGLRLGIVGTGDRGTLDWGTNIVKSYADKVRVVGLCDINGLRVKAARGLLGDRRGPQRDGLRRAAPDPSRCTEIGRLAPTIDSQNRLIRVSCTREVQ